MKAEIPDLLTLTVDAIKDYQTCERLYDYRHNQKMYESIGRRDLLAARYENILMKVVSFYFYKKQAGNVPSYSALLNRWERLWFPKDMTAYDIAVEQHESAYGNLASYSTDAAAALLRFYEDYENDPGVPLLIDEKFTVVLRREIRLEGTFDLVLRSGNEYCVVKWSTKARRPGFGSLLLDFASQRLAFETRNADKKMKVTYGLHDLGSSKPGFYPVEIKNEDIKALTFWANQAFEEETYPSRRGLTYYCKSCPFDKPCQSWKEWPDA